MGLSTDPEFSPVLRFLARITAEATLLLFRSRSPEGTLGQVKGREAG